LRQVRAARNQPDDRIRRHDRIQDDCSRLVDYERALAAGEAA
jgi:hypothetical protein